MAGKIFVGFGFGPIQSGLFLNEAFQSGNFSRLVVAEVDSNLVDAIRANNGSYYVNVARSDSIDVLKIDNLEILNPNLDTDREKLLQALREATEISTSLPAVKFYEKGENSTAALIAQGIMESETRQKIIYTAENNNHAAEILQTAVDNELQGRAIPGIQFLNSVIGKMSGVITSPTEIHDLGLKPIAPGIDRAFLVEEFNKILVSRIQLPDFNPGIEVFIEKDDLLPFEEAKLYGHNAIHALLAYLAAIKGYTKVSEVKQDQLIMDICRNAFLNESGRALIKKYAGLNDELFTVNGYQKFADDLLTRMTNPFLADTVERAGRDPVRKLGFSDRIFGTMTLALEYGIEPENMAMGAVAGIAELLRQPDKNNLPAALRLESWHSLDDSMIERVVNWLLTESPEKTTRKLIKLVQNANPKLKKMIEKSK